MELDKVILLIGIFLNLIGFIILFRYASEPMPEIDYTTYLYRDDELKDKNERLEKKRLQFRKWSKIGFGINIVGFLFQLISLFI